MCRVEHSEAGGRKAGFTIIEVLVAIAVMAFSLTAIGALTGTTARGVRSLGQHIAIVETARTVIATLPSRTQFATEVAGQLYGNQWRIGMSPFYSGAQPIPDSPWIPETISVRVRSPSGETLTLETMRLQRRRQ